ncbi:MAG: hypothetical protein IK102_03385 [Treponema sp.]|nr:hypothetical protein [Treponema sp.]
MFKKLMLAGLVTCFALVCLTGCNFAPEGNPWDYTKIEQNDNYLQEPYEIAPDKKYHGFGYLSTYSSGSGAGWKFINNTGSTVSCKYSEKFFHGDSYSTIWVGATTVENPGAGFEVKAGESVSISAGSAYYIKSGNKKEKFYEFYLACH